MGMLDGFRDMDFLDQITLLNEITGSKDIAALPGLLDLLRRPLGDTSIDYMVVNALNAVLSQHEAKAVEGLASGHVGYRTLCIRVIGEYGFTSAAPVLTSLGEAEADPEQVLEILTALARLRDQVSLPLFRAHLANPDAFTSALCIEMLGAMGDAPSIPALMAIVQGNETDEAFER
ncbi:HEAT repeat domain-containing protein, partial [Desulfovibrio sp.]